MSKRHRFEIELNDEGFGKLLLDGHEIAVRGFTVEYQAGQLPIVTLKFIWPEALKAQGLADVVAQFDREEYQQTGSLDVHVDLSQLVEDVCKNYFTDEMKRRFADQIASMQVELVKGE